MGAAKGLIRVTPGKSDKTLHANHDPSCLAGFEMGPAPRLPDTGYRVGCFFERERGDPENGRMGVSWSLSGTRNTLARLSPG